VPSPALWCSLFSRLPDDTLPEEGTSEKLRRNADDINWHCTTGASILGIREHSTGPLAECDSADCGDHPGIRGNQCDLLGCEHASIAERDRSLRDRNNALGAANSQLEKTNRNYVEMLGFVAHELKSPLAAMQSMIAVLVDGHAGDVSPEAAGFLDRIRKNCEELQDMERRGRVRAG